MERDKRFPLLVHSKVSKAPTRLDSSFFRRRLQPGVESSDEFVPASSAFPGRGKGTGFSISGETWKTCWRRVGTEVGTEEERCGECGLGTRQSVASWVKKGEAEKYGARGHGSMARRGIQRIEVADDHNTRIPGHHPFAIHST